MSTKRGCEKIPQTRFGDVAGRACEVLSPPELKEAEPPAVFDFFPRFRCELFQCRTFGCIIRIFNFVSRSISPLLLGVALSLRKATTRLTYQRRLVRPGNLQPWQEPLVFTRIECQPASVPFSFSKWLLGGTRRSASVLASSNICESTFHSVYASANPNR
jgi:hypothetical protein